MVKKEKLKINSQNLYNDVDIQAWHQQIVKAIMYYVRGQGAGGLGGGE